MTIGDVDGNGFYRQIARVVSLLILCGLLVSCSSAPKEEPLDPVLEANCDRILSNLKTLQQQPDFLQNLVDVDTSIPLLLGSNARNVAEKEILAKFPLLDEVVTGRERDEQRTDFDSLFSGTVFVVQQALLGTDVDFPYDDTDLYAIATDPAGWENFVQPLAKKTFGESLSGDSPQGCEVVDAVKYGYDTENDTAIAFDRASNVFMDLAQSLQVIRNCQVTGWHQGTECAKDDFVSEPSDYTPTNEKTAEELEILEERERQANAEKDAEANSGGENEIRPLQICNTFGVVKQTEKYGALTCKPVMVNKIRTLMWMK